MGAVHARRPWAAALAVALGLGVIVGAGWQWATSDHPTALHAGEIPDDAAVSADAAPGRERAREGPVSVTPIVAPTRVHIAGAGVDTEVIAIGVDRNGGLAVPDDATQVGWWARGAAPGSTRGGTVLVGHVDTPDGPGELFRLRELRPGDRIEVWAGDQRYRYQVRALRNYPRALLGDSGVFDQDIAHRLVVITCGGPYDRERGGYRDNVVVYAALV